jgi:hypothetical protein
MRTLGGSNAILPSRHPLSHLISLSAWKRNLCPIRQKPSSPWSVWLNSFRSMSVPRTRYFPTPISSANAWLISSLDHSRLCTRRRAALTISLNPGRLNPFFPLFSQSLQFCIDRFGKINCRGSHFRCERGSPKAFPRTTDLRTCF